MLYVRYIKLFSCYQSRLFIVLNQLTLDRKLLSAVEKFEIISYSKTFKLCCRLFYIVVMFSKVLASNFVIFDSRLDSIFEQLDRIQLSRFDEFVTMLSLIYEILPSNFVMLEVGAINQLYLVKKHYF
ncbi:Hypothetical_protein [Hexamita inflata]|uniref:Hypothetical_protein n=1 Tax=Hexamita inflata TaxID=28002 RepID=A0AA86QEU5_9EUKA|nr:Hypothetical protein HINF_LOCUS41348 [Hexamita inflata]